MQDEQTIHQALRDIADIRRVIDTAAEESSKRYLAPPTQLHVQLHIVALVLSTALLVAHFAFPKIVAMIFVGAAKQWTWRFLIIGVIATLLILVTACLYFALWKAARREGESPEKFISRNFVYLRNLSFVSDLIVKFTALTLVILTGRPDWVSPLLTIFTGDYLLQGRFFVLPLRIALITGLGCLVFGTIHIWLLFLTIVYPLCIFIAVTVASLIYILRLRSNNTQSDSMQENANG